MRVALVEMFACPSHFCTLAMSASCDRAFAAALAWVECNGYAGLILYVFGLPDWLDWPLVIHGEARQSLAIQGTQYFTLNVGLPKH